MQMTDVLGYRAKIGLMVPFTNTIAQPEYEAITPVGVTNHTARIPNRPRPTHSDEAYRKAMEDGGVGTEDVVDRLTPAALSAIILAHSIDSFQGGLDGAKAFQDRLSAHAKDCPVLVPSIALKDAVEKLVAPGCRVSVLTPYLKPGGDHVMLMGLKAPLKQGDAFPLTLVFEHAGDVTVTVEIGPVGAMGAAQETTN